MLPEDVKKIALIAKSGLFDWNVMLFGMKNTTNIFSRTILKFLKSI